MRSGKRGYKVLDRFYYEDLIKPDRFDGMDEASILNAAHTTITEVVETLYLKNKDVVLALTGGLDSRLLLGALLEVTEGKNIKSFCWGFEDTYDYEIGKLLGKRFGLKHSSYNLMQLPFGIDQLKCFAEISDANTNLFEQPPIEFLNRDFHNANLWLGVLGGTASGSNLPVSKLENPESFFLQQEKSRTGLLTSAAQTLLGESITPADVKALTKDYRVLTHDTLDIYNHHERLIGHTVFVRGFSFVVPFQSLKWLSMCLSLPGEYRNKKRPILVKLLNTHYKALAKLPTANTKGRPLVQSGLKRFLNSGINKFFPRRTTGKRAKFRTLNEFDMQLNELLPLVLSSLDDFEPVLDVVNFENRLKLICNEHQYKIFDHTKTLELIISLIVISRVIKQIPRDK